MDGIALFWFLLGAPLFFGAEYAGRGKWNEGYTSREQTGVLRGIMALGIMLHHMGQKTCAPWHPAEYTVHGLDFFVPIGYLLVGVFLFCSGLGLYRSLHAKPDYLKNFFRRRIWPMVITFYLSEYVHIAVRLLMGQKMDTAELLWYLSGLHMANFNAWYLAVIPFFYLAFWAAFRFCRREGTAIKWVFAFSAAYAALGALNGHRDGWWLSGEWWYNSILLFPLGLLFGRYEKNVTRFFRRRYRLWLALSVLSFAALYPGSDFLVNRVLGYYGSGGAGRILASCLVSAASQWLVCAVFAVFWFLLMMKFRLGNAVLSFFGAMSLDLYLMHGIFAEMFGYSFLGLFPSVVYIRSVPVYILAVLGFSIPAAALFRLLRKSAVKLLIPGGKDG